MIYQGVFLPSNGLSPTSPLPLPVVAILWAPGYNSSGGVVLSHFLVQTLRDFLLPVKTR